jgi:hypothetical protein
VQPNQIAKGCEDDDVDSVKESSGADSGGDEDWMFKTFDKNKQKRQAKANQ